MLYDVSKLKSEKISGNERFAEIARDVLAGFDRIDQQKEHFFVFGVDTKNYIQYLDCVSTGTLDAALVHPREIFRRAVATGVSSVALMHNHPSGRLEPSNEDHAVTDRLIEAGKNLGIEVLDHIIVGSNDNLDGQHYSFRENSSWKFSSSYAASTVNESDMTNSDQELESFKLLPINFAAASLGFRILKHKSSRHSAVMVKGDQKIVCSTSRIDGHGIWFSTAGDHAGGSVIDLVQFTEGNSCSLGDVRKILRPLLRDGGLPTNLDEAGWKLEPSTTDFLGVLARFSNFDPITSNHPYLSDTRQIPDRVLLSERFNGRVFHDPKRGTAIFPHVGSPDGGNDRCLTGYTIKGEGGLTMFSKNGRKGLWFSNAFETDTKLCISEAAIDSLSYAALRADINNTRFISTGGQLNPEQPDLIQSAIEKLPLCEERSGEIVAAVDNDDGGDQLARTLAQIFESSGRDDLTFRVSVPETRGLDWNRTLTNTPAV